MHRVYQGELVCSALCRRTWNPMPHLAIDRDPRRGDRVDRAPTSASCAFPCQNPAVRAHRSWVTEISDADLGAALLCKPGCKFLVGSAGDSPRFKLWLANGGRPHHKKRTGVHSSCVHTCMESSRILPTQGAALKLPSLHSVPVYTQSV